MKIENWKLKIISLWPLFLVTFAVTFNLVLLFPETSIKMDLNDNVFAFTLIKRMDLTLSEILRSGNLLNLPLLIDHWIPEWAMGFPVFNFYQHLPSLVIVLLHRLTGLDLMTVFNWFKYLMLSFYPLVIYKAARKFDLGKEASGVSALASTLFSTQYLYATDYNALVFRGSGMYTQLWGIFFLPLALSYSYQFLAYRRHFFLAVVFIVLALSGHLVFGYIAVLSTPVMVIALLGNGNLKKYFLRLTALLASSFLLLSYWFIPLILNQDFQNKSLWDDYTKFNSYGLIQILKWLVNGQLFDNNRFPVFTILIAMGFFYSLYKFFSPSLDSNFFLLASKSNHRIKNQESRIKNILIPLLFITWLILYFGRYSFGSLFILPLSDGLHGHRLINGVQIAGIFLVGLSGEWLFLNIRNLLKIGNFLFVLVFIGTVGIIFSPALKERYEYLTYNQELIKSNNSYYLADEKDFNQVVNKLKELNAHRMYIGRPGNWGRNFSVGGFSGYFAASVNNINTIGFEPESWSPNTDIEQFFSEYDPNYYNLFNISYVVAPPEEKFFEAPFLKKIAQYGKFVIYQVNTKLGNFDFINSDTLIYLTKKDRFNLDRFWIGSVLMPAKNHPVITFDKNSQGEPYQNFLTMSGLNYYQISKPGNTNGYYNLFGANPFEPKNNLLNFNLSTPSGTVLAENFESNLYRATVETPKESLLMLKVTSHPFWQATIDGKTTEIKTVMPFFMAVKVPAGKHEVEFRYFPQGYKNILLIISLLTIPSVYFFSKRRLNF